MVVKPVIPVLEYAVLYDYISSQLCINKEKPQIGCNGKCYLMNELSRSSENENPQSQQKKLAQAEQVLLFFNPQVNYGIERTDKVFRKSIIFSEYSNLYSHQANSYVFRPPLST